MEAEIESLKKELAEAKKTAEENSNMFMSQVERNRKLKTLLTSIAGVINSTIENL